jgi:hypothetical protein
MLIYEPKKYPSLNWEAGATVICHETNEIVGKLSEIDHPLVCVV